MLIQKHIQVLYVRMLLEGASKTSADDGGRCQGAALRAADANTAPLPWHLESRKRPALVPRRCAQRWAFPGSAFFGAGRARPVQPFDLSWLLGHDLALIVCARR